MRGCGCFLANKGCGGHLPARHAVDGVIDENSSELFAPVCRMDHLGGSNGGHIAVALIADYQVIRKNPLDAGGRRGRSAVGGLDGIKVKIKIGPY